MGFRDVVGGRFELEAPVGEGGMGTVFRAHDRVRDEHVAVKLLREPAQRDVQRFLREGAVLASLAHPGIVRYIAHGQTEDGRLYLAMEWIGGETLAARVATVGLDVAESVLVIRRAAEALGVVHAAGIVHRDIKPSNLILPGDALEGVKVIDFGVARAVETVERLTRTGTAMGTPGYMAPEQARGRRDLDPRVDVFALGCVLFECLTGQPAFSGENELGVQLKIVMCDPPRLRTLCPEAPPALEKLVAKLLAKDPGARPPDGGELAAALALITPPARSPRRSLANLTDVPTRVQGDTPDVFTILAATTAAAVDGRGAEEDTPDDPLVTWCLGAGATAVARLGDGSLLARVETAGDARAAAIVAARLALALRDLLPDRHVVIAASREVPDAVDVATRLLATRALASIFSAVVPHRGERSAVHLDGATADLLDSRFDVRRSRLGCALHGER